MSEMMISARTMAQETKKDVMIWMLGRENEQLNDALAKYAHENDVMQNEIDALRAELAAKDEAIAAAKREAARLGKANRKYRDQHAAAYEHVLAEQAAGRKTKGQSVQLGTVLILIGMVLAFAVVTGILWAVR